MPLGCFWEDVGMIIFLKLLNSEVLLVLFLVCISEIYVFVINLFRNMEGGLLTTIPGYDKFVILSCIFTIFKDKHAIFS